MSNNCKLPSVTEARSTWKLVVPSVPFTPTCLNPCSGHSGRSRNVWSTESGLCFLVHPSKTVTCVIVLRLEQGVGFRSPHIPPPGSASGLGKIYGRTNYFKTAVCSVSIILRQNDTHKQNVDNY